MNFEIIAKAMAKAMFYGDWSAETPNELVIQFLLEKEGLWPFNSEDEMIEKTNIDETIYQEARKYFDFC